MFDRYRKAQRSLRRRAEMRAAKARFWRSVAAMSVAGSLVWAPAQAQLAATRTGANPFISSPSGVPTVSSVTSVGTTAVIVLPATALVAGTAINARRYMFHIWNLGASDLYCTDDGQTIPTATSMSFDVYAGPGGYEKDLPAFVSNQVIVCVAATGTDPIRVESYP